MAGKVARYLIRVGMQFFNPLHWPRVPGELVRYARDLRDWNALRRQRGVSGPVELEPVLFQRSLNSPFDRHYTYQAAWAARLILREYPAEHVDVSSQIAFVAQLAAVVPVTMFEFHKPDIELDGLTLREGTVLDLPLADKSVRSLSCMHVIEHVGLGRYGDPLDPEGTDKAVRELCRVVAPGGSLYLSAPVGRERVAFNAHRVLGARATVDRVGREGLALHSFAYVDDDGHFHDPARPEDTEGLEYGCGCFWFTRPPAASGSA